MALQVFVGVVVALEGAKVGMTGQALGRADIAEAGQMAETSFVVIRLLPIMHIFGSILETGRAGDPRAGGREVRLDKC